jgi:rRNA maturation RNase YbeY
MIRFYVEDITFDVPQKRALKMWLKAVSAAEGWNVGNISIVCCSDGYLLQINKQFLQHDYYTDIITFDYTDCACRVISGDLFISVDTVRANAQTYAQDFIHELYRVIVHGVLHLCGYKDATEAEQKLMRAKEDYYLQEKLKMPQ